MPSAAPSSSPSTAGTPTSRSAGMLGIPVGRRRPRLRGSTSRRSCVFMLTLFDGMGDPLPPARPITSTSAQPLCGYSLCCLVGGCQPAESLGHGLRAVDDGLDVGGVGEGPPDGSGERGDAGGGDAVQAAAGGDEVGGGPDALHGSPVDGGGE